MTKGEMALHVSRLLMTVTQASRDLAEGAWNPEFCASDATYDATNLCANLRGQLDHMAKLARKTKGRSSFLQLGTGS